MRQLINDTVTLLCGTTLAAFFALMAHAASDQPDYAKVLFASIFGSMLTGIAVSRLLQRRFNNTLKQHYVSKSELEQYCNWAAKIDPLFAHTWQYFGAAKQAELFEHLTRLKALSDEHKASEQRPIQLS